MTAVEWLVWGGTVWAVLFAFAVVDLPSLLGRAAGHLRQQHTPHWARLGHVPPPDDEAER